MQYQLSFSLQFLCRKKIKVCFPRCRSRTDYEICISQQQHTIPYNEYREQSKWRQDNHAILSLDIGAGGTALHHVDNLLGVAYTIIQVKPKVKK